MTCDLSHQYLHLLVYIFHAQCPTKGEKGYNMTSVHPNLKEFTHHMLKVLIHYPWDDMELGCQITECPVHIYHPTPSAFASLLPQESPPLSIQTAAMVSCFLFTGLFTRYQDRLPLTALGISMSASVPSRALVLLSSTSLN